MSSCCILLSSKENIVIFSIDFFFWDEYSIKTTTIPKPSCWEQNSTLTLAFFKLHWACFLFLLFLLHCCHKCIARKWYVRENPRAIGKNMNEVILSINDHKYLPNYISLHIILQAVQLWMDWIKRILSCLYTILQFQKLTYISLY